MNLNIYKYSLIALLTSSLLIGCKDEAWNQGIEKVEEYGTLSFANLNVSVSDKEATVSRATTTNLSDFTVEITKEDGQLELKESYGKLPATISLKTGKYSVRAYNGEEELAAFEAPFYQGTQDFTIYNNMVTEVETILCKLSNIKVTIKFTEALKEYVSDNCKVIVKVNEGSELTYTLQDIENARPGYFKAAEGTCTLTATLTGTIDGEDITYVMPIQNVNAGEHQIITYSIKGPDGEIPDPSGSIDTGSGITINVSVETAEHSFNADGEQDSEIPDIKRPGDDDNTDNPGGGEDPENPGPDNPGPDNPGDDDKNIELKFSWIDGDPTIPQTPQEGGTYTINITSTSKLTSLIISINSDSESFIAAIADFGLNEPFDLATPTDDTLRGNLDDLNLPHDDEAKQKSVLVDISTFVPILNGFPGTHIFNLKVTNEEGVEKNISLTFKVVKVED